MDQKKETGNVRAGEKRILEDYEDVLNSGKLNLFTSNFPNNQIEKLSQPNFVGSYHMKESINPKFKSMDNILRGNLELKYSKMIKIMIFNPITISLIVIALLFNIFWILLIFL